MSAKTTLPTSFLLPNYRKPQFSFPGVRNFSSRSGASSPRSANEILNNVRRHDFHPIRDGFTHDRKLGEQGVADLNDKDWLVRTLAVRDLIRIGENEDSTNKMLSALSDENPHVRQIAAMALGILAIEKATKPLGNLLANDPDEVVRAQAAQSLGQINRNSSLDTVQKAVNSYSSKDVRHHAVLALRALENGYKVTPELSEAFRNLDESKFGSVKPGNKTKDFTLPDTEGNKWSLGEHLATSHIVLIWIFADWCPVCLREFQELFELRREFEERGIEVCTLECHDIYPARVMTGHEFEPDYWFSDESFYESYTEKIWWSHLSDRAAAVGTLYGVKPMAFTVHAEWINRPAVVIIDDEGVVRYSYHGTFWGDRPKMKDILDMIDSDSYDFVSPNRLET